MGPLTLVQTANLSSCTGRERLIDATKVFTAGIDSSVTKLGDWPLCRSTPAMQALVFELTSDNVSFADFFPPNLDRFALGVGQIVNFVENYRYLCSSKKGGATFFPLLMDGEVVVVVVRLHHGMPRVGALPLNNDNLWGAEYSHRFVFLATPEWPTGSFRGFLF